MRLLAAVNIALVVCLSLASSVHASGSTISAIVCNSNSGSTVTVASPVSDSTVNQSTFLVAGSVTSATQIEVRIDDVYNSTIPIALSQTEFLFSVTLVQGTHTILLIANDICGVDNGEAGIVITYEPSIIPTPGSEVPTDTTPTLTPDGSAYVGNVTAGIIEPAQARQTGVIVMPYGSSKTSNAVSLPQRVIDESKPETPSPIAPVVAAVPFVAGGGAAGFWWKWKLPKLPRFHR